jgi:histidine triad (HIT) family protein
MINNCLFCKIIEKQAPGEIIYEDEKFVAFKDIRPKAPFHVLVVPRKHIHSLDQVQQEDKILMGELILVLQKIAKENELKGYKVQINVGREGGQEIDHLHIHLLGGYGSGS